jgi:hypothetical protein
MYEHSRFEALELIESESSANDKLTEANRARQIVWTSSQLFLSTPLTLQLDGDLTIEVVLQ